MRIRFRASDFGQVAKQISFVRTETGLLREIGCGDGARVICLFARVMQQLGFWTQKSKPTLTGLAPRRVHFDRPWTQASKPVLTNFSLAAKRRAEALQEVFSSTKYPSPAR